VKGEIGLASKNVILAFTLIVALILTPLIIVQTAHAVTVAPDFTMTGWPDGNTFALSSFRGGKVCLLEFFLTYCPHCQAEASQLVTVNSYFGNSIAMVSVEWNPSDWTDSNLNWFTSTFGVTWRIAKDTGGGWGKYSTLSGNGAVPQIYIIDKNGNIAFENLWAGSDPVGPSSVLIGEINSLMSVSLKLTVASAHDSPSPGVGDSFYASGSSVTCGVTSPVVEGGVSYTCTGWTGTGSVPSSGAVTSTTFTITADSSITWNWIVTPIGPFSLTVASAHDSPSPSVGVHTYTAGSSVTCSVTSPVTEGGVTYACSGWSGSGSVPSSGSGTSVSFTITQISSITWNWNVQPQPPTYLVVRGNDNGIYYRIGSSGSWGNWNALSGLTYDSPAAAICNNELHVVVRGTDGGLYHGYVDLSTNGFSGWTMLDGLTSSAPALTSNSTTLCLVVRGGDNRIYYRFYSACTGLWGSWNVIPTGATVDSPAAAMLGGNLNIVVRGMDGASMWQTIIRTTDNSVVKGWTLISGATPSRPVLTASASTNKLYVVVRGNDNGIYYRSYDALADSWGAWVQLTGSTIDGPGAAVAGGLLHVVVRGPDGSTLWYGYVDLASSVFSGWTLLTGATPSAPTLAS
jgi:peroxiredoxin